MCLAQGPQRSDAGEARTRGQGDILSSRAGPRGVVYGGALQAEDLNRETQAVSGVRKPMLIVGGSGGAPPGNFFKSMSLRMHFRPF